MFTFFCTASVRCDNSGRKWLCFIFKSVNGVKMQQVYLSGCFFLLLDKIVVKKQPNGIVLSCISPLQIKIKEQLQEDLKLEYKDENSGEYECGSSDGGDSQKIYVKFRSESRVWFFGFFASFGHRNLVLTMSVCSLWQLRGAGASFSDWNRHGKPGGHRFDRSGGLSDRLSQPVRCNQLYQEK